MIYDAEVENWFRLDLHAYDAFFFSKATQLTFLEMGSPTSFYFLGFEFFVSFGKRCQFQIEVLDGIEVSRNPQCSRLDATEFQAIKEYNKGYH